MTTPGTPAGPTLRFNFKPFQMIFAIIWFLVVGPLGIVLFQPALWLLYGLGWLIPPILAFADGWFDFLSNRSIRIMYLVALIAMMVACIWGKPIFGNPPSVVSMKATAVALATNVAPTSGPADMNAAVKATVDAQNFQSTKTAFEATQNAPTATLVPTSTPTLMPTNTMPAEPTSVVLSQMTQTAVALTPVVSVTTSTPNVPVAIPCDSIQVSTDNGVTWKDAGENLDTELGKRVTWTNRRTVIPNKAWDQPLTPEELKLVETTWVKVRFNACNGNNVVLFAGGVKIGSLQFNKGVLFQLTGQRDIEVRNGELVIWLNDQTHQDKDLKRIVDQIKNGNFDIKSRLAFAVTDSLKDKLPADIMAGVQIVLIP